MLFHAFCTFCTNKHPGVTFFQYVNRMAIKGKQLMPQVIAQVIRKHLTFHEEDLKLAALEMLLDRSYDYKVENNFRGVAEVLSPSTSFIEDIGYYLQRSNFLYVNREKQMCEYVYFNEVLEMFMLQTNELLTFDYKNITIDAYKADKSLHCLKIEATSKSLTNFKRIKHLLNQLKQKYGKLTAQCAKSGCNYIGTDQKWRFKKNNKNKTKLQRYWKQMGWVFERDGVKMEY